MMKIKRITKRRSLSLACNKVNKIRNKTITMEELKDASKYIEIGNLKDKLEKMK